MSVSSLEEQPGVGLLKKVLYSCFVPMFGYNNDVAPHTVKILMCKCEWNYNAK